MPRFVFVLVFLFLFLLPGSPAIASTFVGNGGSIFDTELRATIKVLKESVRAAEGDPSPCECGGESKQCAILLDLSDEQLDACKAFIAEKSKDFLAILNQSERFRFELSSEEIRLEGSNRRFDAVASSETKLIVLDEERFAKISSTDRAQLLAHEFLHFLKYKGKPLTDKGDYGPFRGAEGGRQFLDTIAAAYVIIGMRASAIPLEVSSVSRPFKNLYLHTMGGNRDLSRKDRKESLFGKRVSASSTGLTWFPRESGNWGWGLDVYNQDGSKRGDFKSEIHMTAVRAGVVYRLLPFETGHTWLSSWQIWANAKAGLGTVEHSFEDDFVSLSETTRFPLASAGLSLHVPLFWNFWLIFDGGVIYSPYQLKDLGIQSRDINLQSFIGVSYGFQI